MLSKPYKRLVLGVTALVALGIAVVGWSLWRQHDAGPVGMGSVEPTRPVILPATQPDARQQIDPIGQLDDAGTPEGRVAGSSSASQIPEDTPLEQLVPLLGKYARRGDRAAALRLKSGLMRCRGRLGAIHGAEGMLAGSNIIVRGSAERALQLEHELAEAQRALAHDEVFCRGIDQRYVREHAFDILLDAARVGDEGAAACFVSGFLFPAVGPEMERMLDLYHANALGFAERGARQGDWRMVALMPMIFAGGGNRINRFVSSLMPRNERVVYAWLSVAMLGAFGGDAEKLDHRLAAWGKRLSAEERHAAQLRARAVFDAYFADQPPYTEARATPCHTPVEAPPG